MSAYRLGNAPNLYNADGSPAGQMGLDGVEYPSSVSGGGGAVSSVAGRTGDVVLAQADITANAPVAISNATTLTAASHANRQLIYNGTTATLTISADATGGWANDDSIEIHTLAGSAGVPTLATPDGKSVTGSATKIIGAVRKGTDVWTTGTTDPAVSTGGATLPNLFDGQGTLTAVKRGGTGQDFVGAGAQGTVGTVAAVTAIAVNGVNFPQRQRISSITSTANSSAYNGSGSANEMCIVPGTTATEPTARARGSYAVADALTSCRVFFGMASATPGATTDASAQTNCAGFGADAADSQLTFMSNDASGTCTKVTLNGGTGFPANTNQLDLYEWYVEIVPGATRTINYYIKNLVTGVKATGSVTTDVPAAGTGMRAIHWRNTAANTTAVVAYDYGNYATGGWAQLGATS